MRWADASTTYFFYDGNLQRYAAVINGTATYFLWDGPNILQELNADGTTKEEHTHAKTPITGIGQLVETNRPGQTQQKIYPIMDPRGSITKYIQTDGATVFASREYDAFGNLIPNSSSGTWPGRFGFQGQSWQEIFSANGNQRFLLSPMRLYDPVTGRFIQNERILRRRPTSHYLYATQNPVIKVDPTGLYNSPINEYMDGGGGGGPAVQITSPNATLAEWAKNNPSQDELPQPQVPQDQLAQDTPPIQGGDQTCIGGNRRGTGKDTEEAAMVGYGILAALSLVGAGMELAPVLVPVWNAFLGSSAAATAVTVTAAAGGVTYIQGVPSNATGSYSYVMNVNTGQVVIGQGIHPVIAEAAGMMPQAENLIGGFVEVAGGKIVSWDFSSGTFPGNGTALMMQAAQEAMRAASKR